MERRKLDVAEGAIESSGPLGRRDGACAVGKAQGKSRDEEAATQYLTDRQELSNTQETAGTTDIDLTGRHDPNLTARKRRPKGENTGSRDRDRPRKEGAI